MGLNKARGDMYDFISHTWNPIKGRCPHQCGYCYVDRIYKRFKRKVPPLYLDERELETHLGRNKFIFVGSSTDMWANDVPVSWLERVVVKTQFAPDNTYLWHTKNPARITGASGDIRLCPAPNYILCATIETNGNVDSKAPSTVERLYALHKWEGRLMITVEPVMDFDQPNFAYEIIFCKPEQVNIGADSGGNKLPEPPKEKVLALIDGLKEAGIRVVLKKNLTRLIGEVE